jgi:hypothetical protein
LNVVPQLDEKEIIPTLLGTGRKIASLVVGGPIGYILIGRNKTKTEKIKGILTVTNKAIYCSVNVYPYDEIITITKEKKSRSKKNII